MEPYDPDKARMRRDRLKLLEKFDPVAFAREVKSGGEEGNKLYAPGHVEYAPSHVSHPEPEH